jgi:hypothetical protein
VELASGVIIVTCPVTHPRQDAGALVHRVTVVASALVVAATPFSARWIHLVAVSGSQ